MKNENQVKILKALHYMIEGVKKYKLSKKKKIYMMGDFVSNTGPAIVNKNYYKYLKNDVYVCNTNNKLKRVLHFYSNIIKCDVLLISGLSKFHSQSCNIAKKLGKKVIYLMHGYSKMESKINEIESIMLQDEETIFLLSDKILCVSENFSNFFKKENPTLTEKIEFVNSGIEMKNIKKKQRDGEKFTIISVGGGLKIKNNLLVCKAIEKIENIKIDFVVIGKLGKDGKKIKKYDFVEYYEYLEHSKVLEKMQESDVYIQNSYSETFGLAVIEAISMGCKILISKNVGALSIIDNITEEEIINDNENIEEIADKIKNAYANRKNNTNYINDYQKYTWEKASENLLKKCMEKE